MAKEQTDLIVILIIASMLLFVASIIWWINRTIKNKRMPEKYGKAGLSTALVFSVFLIVSIWLLRFAAGYYAIVVSETGTQQLTSGEEFVNSLFGALRTFSMDEEYSKYIISIKSLVKGLIPAEHWSFSVIQFVAVAYASVLNLVAPVIGGAIILEILASVFPRIRLRWAYIRFGRPKYFFSELNAASLALAKSIYYKENEKKPILIFTDTYIDEENEKEYDLLLEAKKYGAVCVRDDLIHVAKTACGTRTYYLMDENEFGNMQTLLGLIEDHNIKYIRNSSVYLFVQSDAYVQIEKQVYRMFSDEKKKKLLKGGEEPTIIPIFPYRNLVHNLMVDVPLYEPLIHKEDNTKLNLTILGNGIIGTEAFLSAYWIGQMLICRDEDGKKTMSECEMTINVVSKDTEEEFWSKIDYINPEIKETIRTSGNSIRYNKNRLLAYDSAGNSNNPYCSVKYIKADVKVGDFWDSYSEDTQKLLESDYFIVALGNDADNLSVADKLRRLIGKKHLEEAADAATDNVVIAYAVFNSELAEALNKNKYYQCKEKGKTDIYMHAFGSLEQVYSHDNIRMSKSEMLALGTGAAYDKTRLEQNHISDNKKSRKNENGNYSKWADFARAMHVKYKVFSLGLIKESVFDYNFNEAEYTKYVQTRFDLYEKIALAKKSGQPDDDIKEAYNDAVLKSPVLAWLEHRRWVAFMRTMGFRHTDEIMKNFQLNGKDCKNMELKLHPCLVEVKKPMLNGENVYMHEALNYIFAVQKEESDTDNQKKKDVHKLKEQEMIALLSEKKSFLESRMYKLSEKQNAEFNLLDKLTYDWCKKATGDSIIMADEFLKVLQSSDKILSRKETEEKFVEAYNGIFCYDFKQYDDLSYDFDKE